MVIEPTEANGPTFDTRLAKNRGVAVEWEKRCKPMGHAERCARWASRIANVQALSVTPMLPDGTTDLAATRRPGTKKYGFGLNAEQEVTKDIGLFARYGWSDAWAFTQMDRSASGGHRSAGTSLELLDAILVNADQRAG